MQKAVPGLSLQSSLTTESGCSSSCPIRSLRAARQLKIELTAWQRLKHQARESGRGLFVAVSHRQPQPQCQTARVPSSDGLIRCLRLGRWLWGCKKKNRQPTALSALAGNNLHSIAGVRQTNVTMKELLPHLKGSGTAPSWRRKLGMSSRVPAIRPPRSYPGSHETLSHRTGTGADLTAKTPWREPTSM